MSDDSKYIDWEGECERMRPVHDAAMKVAKALEFVGVHVVLLPEEREVIANLLNACRAAEKAEHE